MTVRNATISDANAIRALINDYAEHDKMLFRPLSEIYEKLQTFLVAESNEIVVGCCALEIVWSDLAEIKSLAVGQAQTGQGVGTMLVQGALDQARRLGIPRVFALTLEPRFFEKLGFHVVAKDALPMKVWSDCARCPKQQDCDETALVRPLQMDG